jgi:hypothetical protein
MEYGGLPGWASTSDVAGGADVYGGMSGAWDIGDVAMEAALLQVETLDGEIRDRLGAMQQLAEVRKAYRERIAELNGYLKAGTGSNDGSKVWVPESECDLKDYAWSPEANGGNGGVVEARVDSESDLGRRIRDVDPDGVWYREEPDPAASGGMRTDRYVLREELEAEIDRLTAKAEGLSSDSEIGMLQLNRMLNRRNQVLQLTSNVLGAVHESAMGIISNLKV